MPLPAARAHLARGVWISVSQVAQVLLNGTDLLVIGALLGPAAVVPYACTGKLLTLLANQPQLFMQTALPALSELRASVPRERMFQVSTAMSQLLLISSGAIACVVLTVNGPFVSWWVGPDRFAGPALTGLLVLGMLLRHWNVAAVYTLFCFGHERRLAITTAVDGLVSLVAMLLLVPWLGMHGAALGSLIGTAGISLPGNLRALAREEGVSLAAAIRPLRPWFGRFVPAFATVLLALAWWPAQRLPGAVFAGSLVAILYARAHVARPAATAAGHDAGASPASVARPHSGLVEASGKPLDAVMMTSPQAGRPIAGHPVSRLRAVRSRLFWSVVWPRIRRFVERTFHTALLLHTTNFTQTRWLGRPIRQNVLDLWTIQETIATLRPEVIIETGTFEGGSALFYAELLDRLGGAGVVVTIDSAPRSTPTHPRVTYLVGDSTSRRGDRSGEGGRGAVRGACHGDPGQRSLGTSRVVRARRVQSLRHARQLPAGSGWRHRSARLFPRVPAGALPRH